MEFRTCAAKLSDGSPMEISVSQNILITTENYFLECIDFNSPTLVVTFEAAGLPLHRPDKFRSGWGSNLLRNFNVSHLCVKPKTTDWYLKPNLALAFERLKN